MTKTSRDRSVCADCAILRNTPRGDSSRAAVHIPVHTSPETTAEPPNRPTIRGKSGTPALVSMSGAVL